MSVSPTRKMNAETYAFSWSLPAGGEGPDYEGTVLHSVPLAEEASPAPAEEATEPAEAVQTYPVFAPPHEPARKFSVPSLRVLGVLGWSAVAGAGMMGVTKSGAMLGAQALEIAGIWAALGAAIWFLPQLLTKAAD